MTSFHAIRLLCLPALFTGMLLASPVDADGGHYRAAPPQTNYYGDRQHRVPHHHRSAPGYYRPAPSVQVQSSGYRLYFSSGDSRPGLSPSYLGNAHERNRQHRPERHHRGNERSPQYRTHLPYNAQPHAQPGNPRAGENRLGSGNSQMRRPPQMHDSGPMQRRQYERRYR